MARSWTLLPLCALLTVPLAVAGGATGPRPGAVGPGAVGTVTAAPALPTLSVNAASVGRTATVGAVSLLARVEGPAFFFPAHTRAVLNRPGERWAPSYETDQPRAYVGVYPLTGLNAQYPEREPNTVGFLVNSRLTTLKGILSGAVNPKGLPVPLPYFPLPNAHQVTAGSVKTLETPDVVGVRYLTVHSQEGGVRYPRESVEYTFQGLTRDGLHLVSVHLPYAPASLPTRAELARRADWTIAPFPSDQNGSTMKVFREKNAAYLADLTRRLNTESRHLNALDAVVRSIRVR